jgi:hypothetical protein
VDRYYIPGIVPRIDPRPWVLGALFAGAIEFAVGHPYGHLRPGPGETCRVVAPASAISKGQLARLLALPEGESKTQVQHLLQQPFCSLTVLQLPAGQMAKREVYPLDFLPRARVIVFYGGDRYLGYQLEGQGSEAASRLGWDE